MTERITLEKAIEQVHDRSVNHFDEVISLNDMAFESLDRMWIGNKPVSVLPSAQRLLANRLRVPFSYITRCPAELQEANLSHWLEMEKKRRQTFFCRFDGGNTLRAVFTQRYRVLDHMEVLTKMLENGFDPGGEVHFSFDSEIMVLKVPEYGRGFELVGNDRIVPGVSIANSETGLYALSIEAFLLRIVCTNGLIAKTAVGSRFKHISRRAFDEFTTVLNEVITNSANSRDRLLISMESHVDNPTSTIETLGRQFQLSQTEIEVVSQAYYLEQGATMFHILNAFTRAAQDKSLSASDAYRLEKTGGQILSMFKA